MLTLPALCLSFQLVGAVLPPLYWQRQPVSLLTLCVVVHSLEEEVNIILTPMPLGICLYLHQEVIYPLEVNMRLPEVNMPLPGLRWRETCA